MKTYFNNTTWNTENIPAKVDSFIDSICDDNCKFIGNIEYTDKKELTPNKVNCALQDVSIVRYWSAEFSVKTGKRNKTMIVRYSATHEIINTIEVGSYKAE